MRSPEKSPRPAVRPATHGLTEPVKPVSRPVKLPHIGFEDDSEPRDHLGRSSSSSSGLTIERRGSLQNRLQVPKAWFPPHGMKPSASDSNFSASCRVLSQTTPNGFPMARRRK